MRITQTATGFPGDLESLALGARIRKEYNEFVRITGGNTESAFMQLGQALLYATWSPFMPGNPVRDMCIRVYDSPTWKTIEIYKPGVPSTAFGLVLSFGPESTSILTP